MRAEKAMWVEVCDIEAIPVRGARVVKTPSGCVALFRTVDGGVFALDDKCPHKGGPLSQGIVHGRSVSCPLHNWVISLESGAAEGPDEGRALTHEARVVEGKVRLRLPADEAARLAPPKAS